jgi:hypothetical protein
MTYPASLRQQAAWVRESLDPATPDTQRITLGDVDVEELEAAADHIEALEKHKRLQMEDVMNLGVALGQAQVRIEALEALLRERDK